MYMMRWIYLCNWSTLSQGFVDNTDIFATVRKLDSEVVVG